MATTAKFIIFVPKADELGNPLKDIAQAAHHVLAHSGLKIDASYIDPDKRQGNEVFDLLTSYAEETPETDSHMKQMATYIGEVVNLPSISVAKEGKGGTNVWEIRNPNYRQSEGAQELSLDLRNPLQDQDTHLSN